MVSSVEARLGNRAIWDELREELAPDVALLFAEAWLAGKAFGRAQVDLLERRSEGR